MNCTINSLRCFETFCITSIKWHLKFICIAFEIYSWLLNSFCSVTQFLTQLWSGWNVCWWEVSLKQHKTLGQTLCQEKSFEMAWSFRLSVSFAGRSFRAEDGGRSEFFCVHPLFIVMKNAAERQTGKKGKYLSLDAIWFSCSTPKTIQGLI